MDEKTRVRKKLERSAGRKLPEHVWADGHLQKTVDEYLDPPEGWSREDIWSLLEEDIERLIPLLDKAKTEALEGVKTGLTGMEDVPSEASVRRDKRKGKQLEAASFVSPKTTAMLRAMSELFAGLAHQHPDVLRFRDEVLGGRLLTEDEAHGLLSSAAARLLDVRLFKKWGMPIVGHTSRLASEYQVI